MQVILLGNMLFKIRRFEWISKFCIASFGVFLVKNRCIEFKISI